MLINKHRGFSLIELLVVISIVGLLSSITASSLNSAKNKAKYAKAAADEKSMETALALYYENNGDYPTVGATLEAYSAPGFHWDTLATALSSYLPTMPMPAFPTIVIGGELYQGYGYFKGTASSNIKLKIINSSSGVAVACVIIKDGFWLDFLLPEQNSLTLNDGGVDPDGIETFGGDYQIAAPAACP